ncbi:MAG TPA: hypothetical protein VN379_10980 [Sporomusa sp.]|nr:hypothetical protein [Sporomusa sp.]
MAGHQATVTVGTIIEKTRVDLTKWFLAMYLVAHDITRPIRTYA